MSSHRTNGDLVGDLCAACNDAFGHLPKCEHQRADNATIDLSDPVAYGGLGLPVILEIKEFCCGCQAIRKIEWPYVQIILVGIHWTRQVDDAIRGWIREHAARW